VFVTLIIVEHFQPKVCEVTQELTLLGLYLGSLLPYPFKLDDWR